MTGAESLSLGTQPVTEIPSDLSLWGRCGGLPAEGVGRDKGSAAGEGFPLSHSSPLKGLPCSDVSEVP